MWNIRKHSIYEANHLAQMKTPKLYRLPKHGSKSLQDCTSCIHSLLSSWLWGWTHFDSRPEGKGSCLEGLIDVIQPSRGFDPCFGNFVAILQLVSCPRTGLGKSFHLAASRIYFEKFFYYATEQKRSTVDISTCANLIYLKLVLFERSRLLSSTCTVYPYLLTDYDLYTLVS